MRRTAVGLRGRILRRVGLTGVFGFTLIISACCVLTAAAEANSPISEFAVTPSSTQAGGHPDIRTLITVENRETQNIPAPSCNCQDARDITVDYPPGVIGDPHATPQCTPADFGQLSCPVDSQVGTAVVGLGAETPSPLGFSGKMAVYNLIPHPGQAGLLGFNFPLLNFAVYIVISPRTESDYGLKATVVNINHIFPLAFINLNLWGVPADPSHDPDRLPVGWDPFFEGENPPTASNSPLTPFLDNPTTCGVALSVSAEVLSFDEGTSNASNTYPGTTGCDQLSFNPSLYAEPTTTETDSASGLEVDLQVPQEESPTTPSPSEIEATTVTLPEGIGINPNAADGKSACSDTAARLGTEEEAQCPEYSKIGTVTLISSALPGPLPGYIYIGEPKPGERYRLILTANGFDVHVKLEGKVTADPKNGQLVISFENLPQTPFEEFNMHFFGSERGLLATPPQCGTLPVISTFKPWDSFLPEQTSTQYFRLESGPDNAPCPGATRPFSPSFEAGVDVHTGGSRSDFSIDLTRNDGDQNLSAVDVTTPPGLLATLADIPYCSDAALTAAAEPSYSGLDEVSNPSCPVASQIGVSDTGAGAGSHPVYLPGKVYLGGPYRGAPLSLAVITPAISGPYDLGNVVVRAALHVNPETAQITASSDPLPQILEGIPLRLRSILIELDRANFALNPTNCDSAAVNARASGDQGAQANLSYPFQVTDCSELGFAPKLALSLSGATKRTGNPALHTILTAKPGEANISRAAVTLPKGEIIDNTHIKSPCTRVQFNEGSTPGERCPAGSILGYATAETPLLEKPLEGPVYLRSAPENKSGLPDIVAALNGQIDIELDGKIDTVHESLRATFPAVPDAPVSRFTLNLDGGAKGLLINSENLCATERVAKVRITGQNDKSADRNLRLGAPCPKKTRHRRHSHSARRAAG